MNAIRQIALFFGFLGAFFSFSSFAVVPGVTDKEIKLGNHSVQSGDLAALGAVQRTMKAYFEMINEKGGVNGRKINLLISDSANNPNQALQATKKLIEEDNVLAMVGCANFPHSAVYKYLRQKGVPDLWIASGLADFTEPNAPTTFAWNPTLSDEGKFFGEFIAKKWPGKTLGILSVNAATGKQGVDAITKGIDGKLKVIVEEVQFSGDPTAKAQILKFKEAKADIVMVLTLPPVTPAAMKFAKEQGYKPQWILNYANTDKVVLNLAGKDVVEGAISSYPTFTDSDLDQPAVKTHLEFVKSKLPGQNPGTLTLSGQAIAELTVETLKRAGKDLTRESVVKAAESIRDWKCSVCRSPSSVDSKNHRFMRTFIPLTVHDGKWVLYK